MTSICQLACQHAWEEAALRVSDAFELRTTLLFVENSLGTTARQIHVRRARSARETSSVCPTRSSTGATCPATKRSRVRRGSSALRIPAESHVLVMTEVLAGRARSAPSIL